MLPAVLGSYKGRIHSLRSYAKFVILSEIFEAEANLQNLSIEYHKFGTLYTSPVTCSVGRCFNTYSKSKFQYNRKPPDS